MAVAAAQALALATAELNAQAGLQSLAAQQADDIVKCLLDIDAVLGRSLDKLAAELAGQGMALLRRHLALRDAVALVADEHDGHGVGGGGGGGGHGRSWVGGSGGGGLLDALDLVVEAGDAGEGRARRDAVDQHEALAVADPLVAQRGILLLAGGIEHLEHARLPVDDDLFAVRVLDGGVVLQMVLAGGEVGGKENKRTGKRCRGV